MPPHARISSQLATAFRSWWREQSQEIGPKRAAFLLLHELWEFVRDSTPERRQQRFGDMEYDWEHRVNTTAGTIGWRERLLGTFRSAYQPTEPAVFHEMMAALPIDFREFTFIDIGSGKGRTLLMASEYPFHKIVGVEIMPELHRPAVENIREYQSETQKCRNIESVCVDAVEYAFPTEPLVLYLFNPLPLAALRKVLQNLENSVASIPRPVYIVYCNPLLEGRLTDFKWLRVTHRANHLLIYEAVDC